MPKPDLFFAELYAQAAVVVDGKVGVEALDALIGSGLLAFDELWDTFDDAADADLRVVSFGRKVRYVTPWALPDQVVEP